jgi:phage gpG-like protein
MGGYDFEIKVNNIEEVDERLNRGIENALEAMGMQVENYAKAKCPVDTGLLRNSITHAVAGKGAAISSYHATYGSNRTAKGNRRRATSKNAGSVGFGAYSGTAGTAEEKAVYIGTNVQYAPYVELGAKGGKTPAQPFLRPAVEDHVGVLKRLAEAAISESLGSE